MLPRVGTVRALFLHTRSIGTAAALSRCSATPDPTYRKSVPGKQRERNDVKTALDCWPIHDGHAGHFGRFDRRDRLSGVCGRADERARAEAQPRRYRTLTRELEAGSVLRARTAGIVRAASLGLAAALPAELVRHDRGTPHRIHVDRLRFAEAGFQKGQRRPHARHDL